MIPNPGWYEGCLAQPIHYLYVANLEQAIDALRGAWACELRLTFTPAVDGRDAQVCLFSAETDNPLTLP